MRDEPNPTLARRRLAVRLRQARERNGRTLEELAGYLRVSAPQASRLDNGARGYHPDQVRRLTDWYSSGSAERKLLLELSEESRRRAWWQQVDLADSYRTLIGLERGAATINEYCGTVVSGLLQTRDYARAVATGSTVGAEVDQRIDEAVNTRLRRQAVLGGARAPALNVVIDESTLARVTGGPEVMRAQLEHLLQVAAHPRVTLRVMGFEAGSHLGINYPQFVLLDLRYGVPDVVYAESGRLDPDDTDDPDVVEVYRHVWNKVGAGALTESDSTGRISTYLASYSA